MSVLSRFREWRSGAKAERPDPRTLTSQQIFDELAPSIREDARTYVLHGDNRWGNSITWQTAPSDEDPHKGVVVGWLSLKPRAGDRLLVAMQSGQWGVWVIVDVDHAQGVSDMFFAVVVGAFGYVPDEEAPRTKSASEFLKSEFV